MAFPTKFWPARKGHSCEVVARSSQGQHLEEATPCKHVAFQVSSPSFLPRVLLNSCSSSNPDTAPVPGFSHKRTDGSLCAFSWTRNQQFWAPFHLVNNRRRSATLGGFTPRIQWAPSTARICSERKLQQSIGWWGTKCPLWFFCGSGE